MPFKKDLRAHGKSPHVVHVRNSYSILVRDGMIARVKAMAFFSGFHFVSNIAIPIQAPSLPLCGVYFIQEMLSPDGDADAGEVRFRLATQYGFSVIVQNNDPEVAEYQLDIARQTILTGLASDHTFYGGPLASVQGFSAGKRQHNFGSVGKDNETPIAELRFELTLDLGTETYPPYVPDDLEVIHVTTRWPGGGTEQQIHDTQQVQTQYDDEQ